MEVKDIIAEIENELSGLISFNRTGYFVESEKLRGLKLVLDEKREQIFERTHFLKILLDNLKKDPKDG